MSEKLKRETTLAQKKAQKKYDEKTKTISIKYTPNDMNKYKELKSYLDRTGQSANGFIKKVVNDYIKNGGTMQITSPKRKEDEEFTYKKFDWIDTELIQELHEWFDKSLFDAILDDYFSCLEEKINEVMEEYSIDFEEEVQENKDDIDEGEVEVHSQEELYDLILPSNYLC